MFNRAFQVRMVKDQDTTTPESDTAVADRAYILHETVKSIGKTTVGVMAAYITLDTLRIVANNLTK